MCQISIADDCGRTRGTNSLIAGRIRCAWRGLTTQPRREKCPLFQTKGLADAIRRDSTATILRRADRHLLSGATSRLTLSKPSTLALCPSNIEPLDQPVLDLKNVTDHLIHKYPALEIAHDLMDFDDELAA